MELMMVLAIAALMLTIAVPSYLSFTQNSRLTKQVNLLSASISAARSEAAKRGARVVLCQSSDPTAAEPACSGTAGNWSSGWVVFVDGDNDLTIDHGADPEFIVGIFQPETGVNILTDTGLNLAFNSDGTTTAGSTRSFAVCDIRGAGKGKKLDVAATGRPTADDATTCTP